MLTKNTKYLSGKKLALLGLGLENQSLLRYLSRHKISCQITICDGRTKMELIKIVSSLKISKTTLVAISFQAEKNYKDNLEKFDVLFRSPGWPLWCPSLNKARKNGIVIDSPMNLFCRICQNKNLIAVTGSKGKGTTASLISAIIKQSGKKVFLGGNIGIAPLDFIDKIKDDSWIVLELSSFQLEDLQISPKIAIITNLFKEHLLPADPRNPNYHFSYNSYWQAKLNIARNQSNRQFLIINENLVKKIAKANIKSHLILFSASDTKSKLVGNFNQYNIGAAEAATEVLGIKKMLSNKAILKFSNLEHRLEKIGEKDHVSFYDNSFSTTPESTELDFLSFSSPIIAIMGGANKGANFSHLAKIIRKKVKAVVMLPGEGSSQIKNELKNVGYKKIFHVNDMVAAVCKSASLSEPGDTVILSTACASFGIFKNYKDRGDQFKNYVRQYIK